MNASSYDYGFWGLTIFNIFVFTFFALSFFKPKTKLDWRACGAFLAFIVALFTEMYGFPLTIYFLSGWLATQFPEVNIFSHSAGRLWQTIFELQTPLWFWSFFAVSHLLIWGGIWFLIKSWRVLHRAQKENRVAQTGPYAYLRHPQYLAFTSVMFGFLIQWPTLPTLLMFPVLLITYALLAKREERSSLHQFGEAYEVYRKSVPAFFPRLKLG